MKRSSSFFGDTDLVASRELNTGYAAVSLVADNIDMIRSLVAAINSGTFDGLKMTLEEPLKSSLIKLVGIEDSILAVSLLASDVSAVAKLGVPLDVVTRNISDIKLVASVVDKLQAVTAELSRLLALEASLDELAPLLGQLNQVVLVSEYLTEINSVADNLDNIKQVNSNEVNVTKVAESIAHVEKVSTHMETVDWIGLHVDDLSNVLMANDVLTKVADGMDSISTTADYIQEIQNVSSSVGMLQGISTNLTEILASSGYAEQAKAARDVIVGMKVATGAAGTDVKWDSATGTLTVPEGDKGAGIEPKGFDLESNILAFIAVKGDYWIASDTGHGWYFNGTSWVDTGSVRGPKGDTGRGLVVQGTDTSVNIVGKIAANEGDFWLGSDNGHGYSFLGGAWVDVGPIRGPQGVQGETGLTGSVGATGTGISGISKVSGDGSSGTSDVYEISLTDGSKIQFSVYNGKDGKGDVQSVAGKTGDVTLSKADVGLANVDNTADKDKPVSIAVQAALDVKASALHSHPYEPLDANITRMGSEFNGAGQLLRVGSDGKLPALDGSLLTGISGSGGSEHYSQSSVPATPSLGATWFRPDTGRLYMRVSDGTSEVWVGLTQQSGTVSKAYVDGLLAEKANIVHTHVTADITDLSATGVEGKSAYQLAVAAGFAGTEAEWLTSLKGESAYETAVEQGFTGTEANFGKALNEITSATIATNEW